MFPAGIAFSLKHLRVNIIENEHDKCLRLISRFQNLETFTLCMLEVYDMQDDIEVPGLMRVYIENTTGGGGSLTYFRELKLQATTTLYTNLPSECFPSLKAQYFYTP